MNSEGEIEEKLSFNALKVSGVSIQISTLPKQYWGEIEDVPPLMYVHMPKDQRTTNAIDDSIKRMHKAQKLNDRILVEKRSAHPRSVVPDYFSNREGSGGGTEDPFSTKESKIIVNALQEMGMIDRENGMLVADPRSSGE